MALIERTANACVASLTYCFTHMLSTCVRHVRMVLIRMSHVYEHTHCESFHKSIPPAPPHHHLEHMIRMTTMWLQCHRTHGNFSGRRMMSLRKEMNINNNTLIKSSLLPAYKHV